MTPRHSEHEHHSHAELIDAASAWAAHDIDPVTRNEAEHLIHRVTQGDDSALAQLSDAFSGRLAFGTAGLRGPLGAGPKRMNRVVIAQTSAGFAAFLHERAAEAGLSTPPSIVIGYDARTNSEVFARDTAEIMAGAGIDTFLLPVAGPTPVTAFAVRHLGVSAGVMVTASHNPPQDNGYKVYLGESDQGSQIIPPADGKIAAHIEAVAAKPLQAIPRSQEYTVLGDGVADAYVASTAAALLAGFPEPPAAAAPDTSTGTSTSTDLTVVYTAMHGVGSQIAQRVFTAVGLPRVTVVTEQDTPDPAFPTVEFPNPEEPGALDLAIATARRVGAALIVAHDPDADRLAVAIPRRDAVQQYYRLSGNELGLLLGWRAAEREHARAALAGTEPQGTLACTLVSSPALAKVAEAYGLGYAETLSGFKWVSRVPGLLFGFEEALGYLTHPEIVHDKDGISAGADLVAAVRELAAEGRTLWDRLDEAAERFGHFASGQVTVRLATQAAAAQLSAQIREQPPQAFGEFEVSSAQDLLSPGFAAVPADVLRYDLADGSRVMIRPSGTEPKLKLYIDTFCDEGSAAQRRETAEAALSRLETAVREYLQGLQ